MTLEPSTLNLLSSSSAFIMVDLAFGRRVATSFSFSAVLRAAVEVLVLGVTAGLARARLLIVQERLTTLAMVEESEDLRFFFALFCQVLYMCSDHAPPLNDIVSLTACPRNASERREDSMCLL